MDRQTDQQTELRSLRHTKAKIGVDVTDVCATHKQMHMRTMFAE